LRKSILRITLVLLLVFIVIWCFENDVQADDKDLETEILVGIYPSDGESIWSYEAELGVEFDHILQYQSVTQLDFLDIKPFLDLGYDVILTIEFDESYANLRDIASGEYDSYLTDFAETLKDDGRMIWLRPLHEFNGNWYSWSVFYEGNSITDFVPAWRHVVQIFRDHDAPVKFQLNYNRINGLDNPTAFNDFYPGDEWVDLVSITSFNRAYTDEWHQFWHSFTEDFDNAYNQITAITEKPIGVAETSSTSIKGDKSQWIIDAFNSIANNYTKVQQVSWFLQNKVINGALCDWDLNTPEEKQAFTKGMNTIRNLNSPTTNTHLAVQGMDNRIYLRLYDTSTTTWNNWASLPGSTGDSPAVAVCRNELHIVVRGTEKGQIWHGYANLINGIFSGWTLLSGTTPSPPMLTANSTHVCLVVRGSDNVIYYRFYELEAKAWGDWSSVPDGATSTTPAAVLADDSLQIVVCGSEDDQIWHGTLDLAAYMFSGWTLLSGSTPSPPAMAANGTDLCLIVRGNNNLIYFRWYNLALETWTGWSVFPHGATSDAPAATITGNTLHMVVRGMDNNQIWHGTFNLNTDEWSEWTPLNGTTPTKPTLTS
jgi:mannan endo-1,4-beta-mannosidase